MKKFTSIITESNKSILDIIHIEKGEPIDLNKLSNIDGGGVKIFDYDKDDKLIDKSPLTKKEKEDNNRGKKITYTESQVFYKKPLLSTKDGVHVYLVDGEYIRDNIYIDYVMGGHGYVYPNYIPENEIWIDKEMNTEDQFTTAIHELIERNLMKNKHMNYNDAHDEATLQEQKVRKIVGEKKIKI